MDWQNREICELASSLGGAGSIELWIEGAQAVWIQEADSGTGTALFSGNIPTPGTGVLFLH